MSKDKPEIGDIWIYDEDNKKYLIVEQDRKEDVFFGWVDGILGLSEDFKKTWFKKDRFPQVATYLGKSKANINELFEVKDEKD